MDAGADGDSWVAAESRIDSVAIQVPAAMVTRVTTTAAINGETGDLSDDTTRNRR